MSGSMSPQELRPYGVELVSEAASKALIELLESKHLYQRVKIDWEAAMNSAKNLLSYGENDYARFVTSSVKERFSLVQKPLHKMHSSKPTLILQNIKIYCPRCESCEVFSPIIFRDIANDLLAAKASNQLLDVPQGWFYQCLSLAYQCQRCKGDPTVFTVRREHWTLILEGRSPIEEVVLSPYLPKIERKYVSDAVVAHNSGKTLAGIFYLRVFLEKFARRISGLENRSTGEEIMDAYAQTLNLKHRDLMPSLRQLYEELSSSMHLAKEDGELFKASLDAIDKHFDMRRIFGIADVQMPIAADPDPVVSEPNG